MTYAISKYCVKYNLKKEKKKSIKKLTNNNNYNLHIVLFKKFTIKIKNYVNEINW